MALSHAAPTPAVAIVLVNWNGWRHTVECCDSLLAQRYGAYHIFIVDNASADDSLTHIGAWLQHPLADTHWAPHPGVARWTDTAAGQPVPYRTAAAALGELPDPAEIRVTLIQSGSNLGFAGGCNAGVRAAGLARFDYIWFLNNDTVVCDDALQALIQRAARDPRIGMVGATVRYYERPSIVQAMGGAEIEATLASTRHIGQDADVSAVPEDPTDIERDTAYVFGASMLVSRAFIRDIGLMSEDYFLYYEEIDWAMRARGKFLLAYAPGSHLFHRSGATSAQLKPAFSTRLYYRNYIRFVGRFFPGISGAARRALLHEAFRHACRGRWTHARIAISAYWDAPHLVRAANAGSPQ